MEMVEFQTGVDPREVLESGDILLFPDGGYQIPEAMQLKLSEVSQDPRARHKNIAYKPDRDKVSGLKTPSMVANVLPEMREYSRLALEFMRRTLPEYAKAWKVDYASFRSIEERGRTLPLNKRNDLLHVDAFPTRPVHGDLILRCFKNVNPDHSREWLVSDPFDLLAAREADRAGLENYARLPGSGVWELGRTMKRAGKRLGLPLVDRSLHHAFMLHFHDWLKANQEYQQKSPQYRFSLPPGSTWMVFTDMVPHAVLGGRFALEQTVIVSRSSLARPEKAPASILARIAGRELAA